VGYVPFADVGAELLFQVISLAPNERHSSSPPMPFSEWTQVFSNTRLCKAILDRLTDRESGTESYRFRRTTEARQRARK
jgi:DNA replication protein DnaC